MWKKITNRMVQGQDTTWEMNIHHFDWGPGVGLYGIWKAWKAEGEKEYLDFLMRWTETHIEEASQKRTVNSTAPFLMIWELYKVTGTEKYRQACLEAAEYLVKQAPRTVDGGLEHTVTENVPGMKEQMWADTLFMAVIFLARIGHEEGITEYRKFAEKQLTLHYEYLWDEEKHLFYHGWSGMTRNHMSGIHWGRANAWILVSTLEILAELEDFDGRKNVVETMQRHMKALCHCQRENGMFGTILDDAASYDEASAAAGIACGMCLAVQQGYAGKEEWAAAQRVFRNLPDFIDEDGCVRSVSGGTPVMCDAQAYKDIPYAVTLYGQGLTIMALTQERECWKQWEQKLFAKKMEADDGLYDENQQMMTEWRGENGYHSRMENCTVHGVVISLEYAYDLMCRGRQEDFERAERIVTKVLSLQDTDSEHDTYGIWPYYLEESLEEMHTPDWNMADFNGKKLYQMLADYGSRISKDLRVKMETALEHACNSIMRRDMGPHYTNISIMGSYLTMAAGEYLQKEYLMQYALKRFRKAHDFMTETGAFQEYNSPSYFLIILADLAAILHYVKSGEFRSLAEDLNDMAWDCLAKHYHYRTKQWAGPHSRFYGMLQDNYLQIQIQRALDYRITLVPPIVEPGLEHAIARGFFSLRSRCPEKYIRYFVGETEEHFEYTRYVHSEKKGESRIAASYVTPKYTLGTFDREMFWNQRRGHISYFGTAEAPIYCDLKCLHDFYDFSSALSVTAQKMNLSLTAFGFCTDGGDAHPDLDPVKNGGIEAEDLRLRFEIGGGVEKVCMVQESARSFRADMEDCSIRITIPYAILGDRPAVCRITEEAAHVNETGGHKDCGAVKCVDIILYEGEKTRISFQELEACCGVIGFEILEKGRTAQEMPTVLCGEERLTAEMAGLRVSARMKACRMQQYFADSEVRVDGKTYLENIK